MPPNLSSDAPWAQKDETGKNVLRLMPFLSQVYIWQLTDSTVQQNDKNWPLKNDMYYKQT